jgi:hypothetical protein
VIGTDQRPTRRIDHRPRNSPGGHRRPLDLSKINFEALAQRFKESKHKNTDLEVLKAAIRAQLEKMIQLNRTPRRLRREVRGAD